MVFFWWLEKPNQIALSYVRQSNFLKIKVRIY